MAKAFFMSFPYHHHIPPAALAYCEDLTLRWNVSCRLAKPRQSKFGDFRVARDKSLHISVNEDLPPLGFLVTFIHEIAHAVVYQTYRNVPPHGRQWKKAFATLMQPLYHMHVFPTDVIAPLQEYMKNPSAGVLSDLELYSQLYKKQHDELLENIKPSQTFFFRSREYKAIARKRTRMLCQENTTGKRYLISLRATVIPGDT